MPKIEITTPEGKKTVPFESPSMSIGRAQGNDVVLMETVASRRHCLIEEKNGTFFFKDLDSHNGTWMGENRVLEGEMAFGQMIRIGKTFIRLVPDEVEESGDSGKISRRFRVNKKLRKKLPTAKVIEEEGEELPPPSGGPNKIATALKARAMISGPLSKQLAPLLEACVNMPVPEGAPLVDRDIRLLNRKSKPVVVSKDGRSRPAEALQALLQLLLASFRTRSTDLHIEPKADVYTIRFRIDGILHPVGEVPEKMGIAILNVVKVLCELDIAKRSIVQEGNFAVELPDRRVDFRVNLTPTVHGQKLALRFLDKATVPSQFENLGMELDAVAELSRTCHHDAGMIILAGPTGSGKTTTLYTALQIIDAESRNIVTIEDPVEYELANTTQISIDPTHSLTFASVLSSVLRQDPDVILVGEIRDQETAKMAMQAATTGHLVLTTLHARDTVGTVFRLLDLGVEPFLIANSVTMCISQRLVRTLCPDCKRPYQPDADVVRRMKLEGRSYGMFYDAVGCPKCMGVGYRNRIALFEMLLFNAQVRDVILTSPTIADIRAAAGSWMFRTLLESGYKKVIEGLTSVEEVARVGDTV